MYKFLYDERQLKNWFDKLVPYEGYLTPYEALFISLAARNKYIDREKVAANLNKTYMFNRKIIYGKNKIYLYNNFLKSIKQLESNEGSYQVKSRLNDDLVDIPNEAMVIYCNINPINTLDTFILLKQSILDIDREYYKTSSSGKSVENCIKEMSRLAYLAEQCYGKSPSNRRWFDIDVDLEIDQLIVKDKYERIIFNIIEEIIVKNSSLTKEDFIVISTRTGFHILFSVKLSPLFKKSPEHIVSDFFDKFEAKEIKLNENGIVPLPGTMQGGYLVKVIW